MDLQKRVERELLLRVSSIGFAALQMNESLGLTAETFGLASGLFIELRPD